MTRRVWPMALALALSVGVTSASAQSATQFLAFFGNGPGGAISTIDVPGTLSGSLTVSFRGDPATGCAAQGLCAYSGTVVVRPGSQVDLAVAEGRVHGRLSYQAQLSLGGGPIAGLTAARVARPGGLCGDAQAPAASLPATIANGVVRLPLFQPGGTLLGTRCAGPLDGDLAGLGPQITLPVAQLLQGRRLVDLSGSWSFAVGGFTGTLSSTMKLMLGRPSHQRTSGFPRGVRTRRMRELSETLTVTRADGQVNLGVSGDPNTCEFLDSCGVRGTVGATLNPRGTVGYLTVLGPATRPYRDFLAALGLSRTGDPRGLAVTGTIGWTGGGTVTSNLGPGVPCVSQGPLTGGVVLLSGSAGRFQMTFVPSPGLRTRCPGPRLVQGQTLAAGTISGRAVGRGDFTVRLSGGGLLSDDGYAIQQRTSLSLTLHRGRIRQQTFLMPGG